MEGSAVGMRVNLMPQGLYPFLWQGNQPGCKGIQGKGMLG